ncbi:MAG TPA: hypothetical protein VMW58_11840 [Anaerolineae bacterium]|nr:hypothetical protein [Anaerolineae bacterium]
MVRRFNLADILLLKRLQDQVACLDLELALLWSPAPLSLALLECLSLSQCRTATFVQDEHSANRRPQGFIQSSDRPDRLSCDVEFAAPALDGSDRTAHLWRSLLEHLSVAKGESGLQRVFATVPDSGQAPEVFRQAGFGAYARRHVLRLDQLPLDIDAEHSTHCQSVQEGDAPALQRLRSSLIPRPVQQAEGGIQAERDPTGILPWWKSREDREYVWGEGGEIQALIRIVIGEEGHWLRILLGPNTGGHADAVLRDSLRLVASYPARPIYCAVREYEGGLQGALNSLGFEPVASELLMVKHTTVRARVPVKKLSRALEKGVETAAPISTSNRCQNPP